MPIAFPQVGSRGDLFTRTDVMARPSRVPAVPGVYAWYFAQVPPGVDAKGCRTVEGLTLLYLGISPKEPPTNGRTPSRSTLRQRLRTHYAGNASGSTLRKTLGCLLGPTLGVTLRRVGSGGRLTLTNPGEQLLDRWMEANAFVAWVEAERPWEIERSILKSGLPLPLNIQGNPCLAHTEYLSAARRRGVAEAMTLPVIADNGGVSKGGPALTFLASSATSTAVMCLWALFASAALADPCKAVPDRGPMPGYLSPGSTFSGPVVYVGDGDSMCVAVGEGPKNWVEVRVADFYAPELHAPGGAEAKATLERITRGKHAVCKAEHRSHDRVVAACRIGRRAVGDLMRSAGVAEGGNGRH